MFILKWFRKPEHQHYEDGCMSGAVELDDGTLLCAMDFVIDEREVS